MGESGAARDATAAGLPRHLARTGARPAAGRQADRARRSGRETAGRSPPGKRRRGPRAYPFPARCRLAARPSGVSLPLTAGADAKHDSPGPAALHPSHAGAAHLAEAFRRRPVPTQRESDPQGDSRVAWRRRPGGSPKRTRPRRTARAGRAGRPEPGAGAAAAWPFCPCARSGRGGATRPAPAAACPRRGVLVEAVRHAATPPGERARGARLTLVRGRE